MRIHLGVLILLLGTLPVQASGILIPVEEKLPPLAMVNHTVKVDINDQVATTHIEQSFRNHTSRQLEATYIFPVPKGASVRKFSMWVNGKEVSGELVEAKKAREIYESIVRRTMDPGLLEYMDHNLLKVRVFPVAPHADQKISMSYTSIVPSENNLISYVYPLKTDGKHIKTLEKFSVEIALQSQHAIQNIYSPTHAITVTRPSDKKANILFAENQGLLDRDFLLYYMAGNKDVELTSLMHRPNAEKNGYFMFLVSPRAELSKVQSVPRDVVFVLDTSGSMRGKRIEQARNALKYCLKELQSIDRFAVIQFATTINKYSDELLAANPDNLKQAQKWVENLEATGGTAIQSALETALAMRASDEARTFTLVFFTDGRPTIGETDSNKILKQVMAKNTANTRIFTFGVGNDVNASMLDQMADTTRGVVTYVREAEDITDKVAGLYSKISHPVLTDLRLTVDPKIKLSEIYPPQLPDLFHGNQLVVLGRYSGDGEAKIQLNGKVGKDEKDFSYDVNFLKASEQEKPFVEDLWARRKVGYLLDEIRRNGEKEELVQEVVTLAKRYGITTPYTSYLIVPDEPLPVVRRRPVPPGPGPMPIFGPGGGAGGFGGAVPEILKDAKGGQKGSVADFVKQAQTAPGNAAKTRGEIAAKELESLEGRIDEKSDLGRSIREAQNRYRANNEAKAALAQGRQDAVQNGALGVNLSIDSNCLRNQTQLTQSAVRRVQNRNVLNVGGVWIDEAYQPKLPTLTIKAMSPAYFRILKKHPEIREVYQLGNFLVWVTPNNTALVIDHANGRENLSDNEIAALFTKRGQ